MRQNLPASQQKGAQGGRGQYCGGHACLASPGSTPAVSASVRRSSLPREGEASAAKAVVRSPPIPSAKGRKNPPPPERSDLPQT